MHYTKYIWGILVLGLVLCSPLPANARAPDAIPAVELGASLSGQPNPKVYAFSQVWTLIVKSQRAHASHFTPELVACLIWEESGFQLVENAHSHALGFGQVMPSTLDGINKRYKTNFTRTQVLTSPDASVEATVLALELAYEWKQDKTGALLAYAGGMQNYRVVQKWLAAEPGMIQARWMDASSSGGLRANAAAQLAAAMRPCSQPGHDPGMLF